MAEFCVFYSNSPCKSLKTNDNCEWVKCYTTGFLVLIPMCEKYNYVWKASLPVRFLASEQTLLAPATMTGETQQVHKHLLAVNYGEHVKCVVFGFYGTSP